MRLLTHSQAETFQRCRRYHYNRYVLGVSSQPTDDLRLGSAIHEGVEIINEGRTLAEAIAHIQDAYDGQIERAQDADFSSVLTYEREKAVQMLIGWHDRWRASTIRIVDVELTFKIPLRNPNTGSASMTFEYGGKIDAIVQLEDGRLAVYELKTVGDDIATGADYWKIKQLDAQIARYLIAARAIGHDCATVLYDAIRKPEIRPKQIPETDADGFKIVIDVLTNQRVFLDSGKPRQSGDETKGWRLVSRVETPAEYSARLAEDIKSRPDFYFARMEIPRLDHELAEAAADLWDIGKDIRHAELNNRHYMNVRACRLYGGRCSYLDTCVNRTDLSGVLPEGFVRLSVLHPELGEITHGSTSNGRAAESSAASASTEADAAAAEVAGAGG